MNIQEYGWVADRDSVIAWNNGFKWLSKLIVSTQSNDDGRELRELLDLHLREGIKQHDRDIKSVVVFYLLGWKMYDLIDEFWKSSNQKIFTELLVENLLKIYSSHKIQMVDFSKLMSKNRKKGILILKKFLNEKIIDSSVSKLFLEGLFSDNDAVFFSAAMELHELVDLLNINPSFIEPHLVKIKNELGASFRSVFEDNDYSLFIHKLELIRPLKNILKYYKIDLLEGIDLVSVSANLLSINYLFTLSKLGYQATVIDYLKTMESKQADKMLLAILMKNFNISKDKEVWWGELISFIKYRDSELVFSLLFFEDLKIDSLNLIVSFLQDAINISNSNKEIVSAFNILPLLEYFGEGGCNSVELIKNKFIKDIWDYTAFNRNISDWKSIISLLFKVFGNGEDQLLEDELLIPLLRTGLLSHHSLISRFIIAEMLAKEELVKLVDDWTEAKIYQMDLIDSLSIGDKKIKLKNFFRIVNLYIRLNKKDEFIIEKLDEFVNENNFKGVVRKKILALINILKGM